MIMPANDWPCADTKFSPNSVTYRERLKLQKIGSRRLRQTLRMNIGDLAMQMEEPIHYEEQNSSRGEKKSVLQRFDFKSMSRNFPL